MPNEIEIVEIVDLLSLKEKLETLVNQGWEIKGVVGYNPHDSNIKPWVIMERYKLEDVPVEIEHHEEERMYTRPEPPKKDISISMGE